MKKVFLVLVLILSISCKDNRPKNATQKKDNEIKMNSYLSVIVKAKVSENDKFQLYYSEEIISQYHPEEIVEVKVKGMENIQNIKFNLPEKIYPIKLRLDLGVNKIESPVYIQEIVLSTGMNEMVFKGDSLLKYFKPNKYIELNNFNYNRKVIDGIYDPFLVSININEIVTNLFKENVVE